VFTGIGTPVLSETKPRAKTPGKFIFASESIARA